MHLTQENATETIKVRTFGLNLAQLSLLLKGSNKATGEITKFALQFDSKADIESLISELSVLKESVTEQMADSSPTIYKSDNGVITDFGPIR